MEWTSLGDKYYLHSRLYTSLPGNANANCPEIRICIHAPILAKNSMFFND